MISSKSLIAAALFFVLSFLGASYAQEITGVTAEHKGQEDLITVKFSSPLNPWTFFLKEPDRLVIDIRGAVYKEGKQQVDLNSENISSVRWAQNNINPPNFRVVADLKKKIERKVSASADGKEIYISITGQGAEKEPPLLIEQKNLSENIEIKARNIQSMEAAQLTNSRFVKEIVPVEPTRIEGFSSVKGFSAFVNGGKLDIGRNPLWTQNRLMVPAKDFFALAGYSSVYDKTSRTAIFRKGDEVEARLMENSSVMTVNGYDRQLAVPAASFRGALYVPFVSVSNMLSLRVIWDRTSRAFYAGERLTKISWEEVLGYKSVAIETSAPLTTYETSFDGKLNVFVITLPGIIMDLKENKFPVKEDSVSGIKVLQDKGSAKVGIYMESPLVVKPFFYEGRLIAGFPNMIRKIGFTEEADFVKVEIYSTKPAEFDLKRFHEPERVVIDIPNSLYGAEGYKEINKGGVLRVRASQFKAEPPASRIVVDTEKELPIKTFISEDKKYMALMIEKPKQEVMKPAKVKALAGKVIVIDPGHGGQDPGALGCSGEKIKEKDMNLAVSLKLAKLLSDAGSVPLLTRDNDVFVSLQDRVDFTKKNNPGIFISVHFNLSEQRDISGTETYYYNDNSKFLAQVIHNNLTFNLKRKDGGIRKVKFYVVYNNTVPSVLVEPLYLSDRNEEALAADDEWQMYIARVLFEGIKQYFEVLRKR
ncbi:MAG: N-acetylmuramoyl-L-alanine amidase [Candidatus Margulisiibacteriota bacterium]